MRTLCIILTLCAIHAAPAVELERVTLRDGRVIEGIVEPADRPLYRHVRLYMDGRELGAMRIHAHDIASRTQVTQPDPEPEEAEPDPAEEPAEAAAGASNGSTIDLLAARCARMRIALHTASGELREEQQRLNRIAIQYWTSLDPSTVQPLTDDDVAAVATGVSAIAAAAAARDALNIHLADVRSAIEHGAPVSDRMPESLSATIDRNAPYAAALLARREIDPPPYLSDDELSERVQDAVRAMRGDDPRRSE
jgi:hypothetical protein